MLAGAASCGDAEEAVCSFATLTGPSLALTTVERVQVATGGAVSSGTYDLTSRELAINPQAGAAEQQSCRQTAREPHQERVTVTATSETRGRLEVTTTSADGSGVLHQLAVGGHYTIAGSGIMVTASGDICETRRTPGPTGGVLDEPMRRSLDGDPMTQTSLFSAGTDTIALILVLEEAAGVVACWEVSTYTKRP